MKVLSCLIVAITLFIAGYHWLKHSNKLSLTPETASSALKKSSTPTSLVNPEKSAPTFKNVSSDDIKEEDDLTKKILAVVAQLNLKTHTKETNSTVFLSGIILFSFLACTTSIGLPRQIAAFVAGVNFGAFIGFFIATLATTLGCLITFSVSRYVLSEKITKKYPEKLSKLSDFLAEQTFIKALVIRILPLGSNFITNIVAGVTRVSMPAYVSGSMVGFIPQMIIFSLAGSGLRLGAENELIASAVLFIIAIILSAYIVKKHRVKQVSAKN